MRYAFAKRFVLAILGGTMLSCQHARPLAQAPPSCGSDSSLAARAAMKAVTTRAPITLRVASFVRSGDSVEVSVLPAANAAYDVAGGGGLVRIAADCGVRVVERYR